MTQAMPAFGLRSTEGRLLTLAGMQVEGVLDAGLAVITLTQQYVNPESVNIEAVYSCPLPVRAVLLEMAVTLDGQALHGSGIERSAAEARYEDAIADGLAHVLGDGAFEHDGQVREAAACIQLALRPDGGGQAGADADMAGAATVVHSCGLTGAPGPGGPHRWLG